MPGAGSRSPENPPLQPFGKGGEIFGLAKIANLYPGARMSATEGKGPTTGKKVVMTTCISHCAGACLLKVHVMDSAITRIEYEAFREKVTYCIEFSEPYIAFLKEIEDPENNPFPTLSGKILTYSRQLADTNDPSLPPIPKYLEAWESRNDSVSLLKSEDSPGGGFITNTCLVQVERG
jgi:anaerobic selenocysteine-containing dehydrogenase